MEQPVQVKRKIINDPVYGFITIPDGLVFQLIQHPWFQRLRRIKQLGITHFVFPGALHTRFHHAIGCLHLITQAIHYLRGKGFHITLEEEQAASVAILLHDIGHGPYSHALENSIVSQMHHEDISEVFMEKLNDYFRGELSLAIEIFKGSYEKKFLHQLISSQLDMDRLDYLARDSFFTGVSEGVTGTDRILHMLNVVNDSLVVESKGIYSIEKFIVARRLMFWQVYLHKTVLSAENMLVKILSRARFLAQSGAKLWGTPALLHFLYNDVTYNDFKNNSIHIENFSLLDDSDIATAVKVWSTHEDTVLSLLCSSLMHRKLNKLALKKNPVDPQFIFQTTQLIAGKLHLSYEEASYLVYAGSTSNSAYNTKNEEINILYPDGTLLEIARASDQLNLAALSSPVVKYYISYPRI